MALGAALAAGLAGCGTPGAPQPPSLNLPDRVADLTAERAGNQVSLTWKMPKKNTDRLQLKGEIAVRVCRREGAGECETAVDGRMFAPGKVGSYTDTLPAALAGGAPRALSYFVELKNRNGKSAGVSNAATVLAGEAPGPVSGLRLTVRKDGVEARWDAAAAPGAVRLHRVLLTPPKTRAGAERGPLAPEKEPLEQNLLIEGAARDGVALDETARTGETYTYSAQRVEKLTVDGQTLELDGEISAPVRVEVQDVFPPAVPTGLAAVATAAGTAPDGSHTPATVDLSWQPVMEADMAGYIVYRRESGGEWQRVSPEQPVVGPAFHDVHVEPGYTYIYAVSAIDKSGHESARSAEAQETVPGP